MINHISDFYRIFFADFLIALSALTDSIKWWYNNLVQGYVTLLRILRSNLKTYVTVQRILQTNPHQKQTALLELRGLDRVKARLQLINDLVRLIFRFLREFSLPDTLGNNTRGRNAKNIIPAEKMYQKVTFVLQSVPASLFLLYLGANDQEWLAEEIRKLLQNPVPNDNNQISVDQALALMLHCDLTSVLQAIPPTKLNNFPTTWAICVLGNPLVTACVKNWNG